MAAADEDQKLDVNHKLPPIQFVVRDGTSAFFTTATKPLKDLKETPPSKSKPLEAEINVNFSKDGSLAVLVSTSQVQVINPDQLDAPPKVVIDRTNVQAVAFSPLCTYLLTWEKPARKGKGEDPDPNLFIWKLSDAVDGKLSQPLASYYQKEYLKEQWPTVKWTSDEALGARLVTNQVQMFAADKPTDVTHKLHQKGVAGFELAPTSDPYKIAVFVPIIKADPACVRIFSHPDYERDDATAHKSFYKAQEASISWNSTGTAVLVNNRTDVDASGKTYYGETGLHLLHADGSFQCTLSFGTNVGPVQDYAWAPSGAEFIVLQGLQPAQGTLFKMQKCTPVFTFGAHPRNTIRYSPHGRFCMLGGFGSCSGEMDFWDMNKKKIIGSCRDRDGAKSFEWSPDGRTFITAVLRPWRRVDNGYKLWTYAGELLDHVTIEKLFQADFRPSPDGVYPNLPMSPRLSNKKLAAAREEQIQAAAPKAYVPPHLRGKGGQAKTSVPGGKATEAARGGLSLSERLKDSSQRGLAQQAKKLTPGASKPGAPVPSEEEDKQSKNAKRAERRKRQKEQERLAKEKEEEEAKQAEEAALKAVEAAEAARLASLTDEEKAMKRQKAINKKLKQIENLKKKREQGEDLDDAAIQKLATEQALMDELASLKL